MGAEDVTTVNGAKAPEVRHVHPCPVCGHHRRIPDHAPSVWSYRCAECGVEVEVNLTRWRDEK
jgi:DNA-directed RNA polymerase subunit RPC12/RpoP